jgi:hypothetical protein
MGLVFLNEGIQLPHDFAVALTLVLQSVLY